MKKRGFVIIIPLFIFLLIGFSYTEEISFEALLGEIFSVPSPSGYEHFMTRKIQQYLPQGLIAEKDNMGSLYLTAGKGNQPLTLLACMDEVGYIVSGINEEGYLLLDRVVPAPYQIYDSFHVGHPMLVWTEKGAVSAVMAIPSVHILSREGRQQLQNFSLDQAFLDIGARSKNEVKEKGVRMLDAVTPVPELTWLTGDKIAGSSLGSKTSSTLLLYLAGKIEAGKLAQETTFIWIAQTKFLARGSRPRAAMGALRVKMNLNPENVLIIDVIPVERSGQSEVSLGKGPVLAYLEKSGSKLREKIEEIAKQNGIPLQHLPGFESSLMSPFSSGETDVLTLGLPVKFPSTPVEVLDLKDILALEKLLSGLLE
jgi:putative aminopeptidase FrvX